MSAYWSHLLACSLYSVYVGAVKGFTHWRDGQAAMNPMLYYLTSYLTDTVSVSGVLSQEIGIYKNKEEN